MEIFFSTKPRPFRKLCRRIKISRPKNFRRVFIIAKKPFFFCDRLAHFIKVQQSFIIVHKFFSTICTKTKQLIPSIIMKSSHLLFCNRRTFKYIFFYIPIPNNMTNNCFKHSIFGKRSTLFCRVYFYLIFRLFHLFFCQFRYMPLILIQEQSPAFIFRSRKFFIFMTHDI